MSVDRPPRFGGGSLYDGITLRRNPEMKHSNTIKRLLNRQRTAGLISVVVAGSLSLLALALDRQGYEYWFLLAGGLGPIILAIMVLPDTGPFLIILAPAVWYLTGYLMGRFVSYNIVACLIWLGLYAFGCYQVLLATLW